MALHNKKMSYKRLCLILDLMMLLIMATFIGYLFMHSPKTHYDVDRNRYPIKGIDISAHNGDIDFQKVAADSVSFVIIKATEGTDFCDAKFKINYQKACNANLKVGAYHFFRFDTPGDVQAHHFLASVNGNQFDLPLIIDVEKWGNPMRYDSDDVKANLKAMTDALSKTGYPIMIYTNRQGYNSFIEDDFDNFQLWICSLSRSPSIDDWTLWQHSHEEHIKGINGLVDSNTYNGDHEKFEKWTNKYTVDIPDISDRQ